MAAESIVECEGCYNTLIVGSVPKDLFIPLPGIDVWDRQFQTPAYFSKVPIGNPIKRNEGPYTKNLTLCLSCFNGHVSGQKPIPFDVLGISIVKAPYTDSEKYLKIEGPTKVVNLLSDDYKSSYSSENVVKEGRSRSVQQTDYNKPRGKRKRTISNYAEDDDDEEDDDDVVVEEVVERCEKESRLDILNLGAPTTVNYLTIGSDMLGAMEMTDD